ncbi:MAG: hypothetical protein ACJ8EF_15930 [Bradyrhizobium sp.]|jgi:hypothetical protein
MESDMQGRLQIDVVHSRAIAREVAERLRIALAQGQPEPGKPLQALIDRLTELDERSPPIAPE